MKLNIFIFVVVLACACAAEEKKKEDSTEPEQNKDKRQTQGEAVQGQYVYRTARKQEQVTPVEEESLEDDREPSASNIQQYRPGQVISLTGQELLELQQERKAPLASSSQLQHLYTPQPEHKQNVQQFYYIDPQTSRQVAFQPSHTVIARPSSGNGGVASVGAALSVSDNGASSSDNTFEEEILALLGHPQETRTHTYSQLAQPAIQVQQVASPNVASPYQQIDRYITKIQPTKKPVTPKLRSKVQINPSQSIAPQQYLIETTNVVQQPKPVQQQQQQQQQQLQQQQQQPQQQQYKVVQQQRPVQTLRYVPIPVSQVPAIQQGQTIPFTFYNPPETTQNQGLKIVAAPKLVPSPQTPRTQLTYRVIPNANYQQQQEVTPKQYRFIEARPQSQPQQSARVEQSRIPASSIDRPVTYVKRYPEPEKTRAVKIFDQSYQEVVPTSQRQPQYVGEQYYLRPVAYRPTSEPRQVRYELPSYAIAMEKYVEQFVEPAPTKPAQSSIYINKNIPPKKVAHQHHVKVEETVDATPQPQAKVQHVNIEQHGQSLEQRRAQLPPPKNNKAYTPEEFAALVAAGYSVTPVPVGSLETQTAQSRSSIEAAPAPLHRRPFHSRRNQYLPLRSDEAP